MAKCDNDHKQVCNKSSNHYQSIESRQHWTIDILTESKIEVFHKNIHFRTHPHNYLHLHILKQLINFTFLITSTTSPCNGTMIDWNESTDYLSTSMIKKGAWFNKLNYSLVDWIMIAVVYSYHTMSMQPLNNI